MFDLNENINLCPCTSGKLYADCCSLYHQGKEPVNALALMRSRYAAYALGLKDYIIDTTHPGSPLYQFDKEKWAEDILKFSSETTYHKLEILEFIEGMPFSSVTFAAHLSKKRKNTTFTEKSYFEHFAGRWYYRNGLIEPGIQEIQGPTPLNLLRMAYLGEEVLFKKAEPIDTITDEIRELVAKMQDTMDALNGIGLAAPQVHHSLRLFIIREPIETEDGEVELGDFKTFINPHLLNPSQEMWLDYEACLSIPGIEAEVSRPLSITVRYTDLNGDTKEETAKGLYAKALMHEMDHLNGVLFYDHLSPEKQEKMKPFLTIIKARFRNS